MELNKQLQLVVNHYYFLIARDEHLTTTIARLTAAGCIDATEYWKDGKYLYLLSPMKNGKRKKRYIGNHTLRIEEARQKVTNYKQRSQCIETQSVIQREKQEIEKLVTDLLKICSREDLSAMAALNEIRMGTNNS